MPVRIAGNLTSLQTIDTSGEKRFLLGGEIKGGFYLLGTVQDVVVICEGFATGASVHEAAGHGVVVALSASNLLPVAQAIRGLYPTAAIIFAGDHDRSGVGQKSATEAATAVGGTVAIPSEEGCDWNDIAVRDGLEAINLAFAEAAQSLPNGVPPPIGLQSALLEYRELVTLDLPARKHYLPRFPEGGNAMLYGPRGIGKTFFELGLAASLVTGTPFLKWPISDPVGVLYVDGEMQLDELRGRMTDLLPEPPKAPLHFLSSEMVYHRLYRDLLLSSEAVRDEALTILDARPEIRVLIFDNISCLFSGIDEDKKRDWEPIAAWLIRLRHRGLATILVHHSGKGGQQRGTSGREDALDTVIQLDRPSSHDAKDGCHFELKFTKCRSVKGPDVDPLDVRLVDARKPLTWAYKSLEVSKEDQVRDLLEDGLTSNAEIAEALGITRAYVWKLRKKIKNGGGQ